MVPICASNLHYVVRIMRLVELFVRIFTNESLIYNQNELIYKENVRCIIYFRRFFKNACNTNLATFITRLYNSRTCTQLPARNVTPRAIYFFSVYLFLISGVVQNARALFSLRRSRTNINLRKINFRVEK